MLEKNGEDQLDRSCEKWSIRVNEERNTIHTIKIRKANWIGHIWCWNCLRKRIIEGKRQEGVEMTGRQGGRRKQLLDDLKKARGCCKLKEEALDHTVWRCRPGRGYGPVVWQTMEWMRQVWNLSTKWNLPWRHTGRCIRTYRRRHCSGRSPLPSRRLQSDA